MQDLETIFCLPLYLNTCPHFADFKFHIEFPTIHSYLVTGQYHIYQMPPDILSHTYTCTSFNNTSLYIISVQYFVVFASHLSSCYPHHTSYLAYWEFHFLIGCLNLFFLKFIYSTFTCLQAYTLVSLTLLFIYSTLFFFLAFQLGYMVYHSSPFIKNFTHFPHCTCF